jgi:hypothetical protein
MTRRFNCKAVVDELATDLWDTTATFRDYIIRWLNEVQDELATELPLDYYRIKMKKLLPTGESDIDLSPDIPAAPTTAISSGGSLVEDSYYKAYVSFLLYDESGLEYIESEASVAGTARQATAANKTLDLSVIPTYPGDSGSEPATIYRRVYVSISTDGSDYGEPFFVADITNNTATTYSVTAEPTSTVTPVSDSEVDQLTSDHPYFASGIKFLTRESRNLIRRYDPDSSTSTSPDLYDHTGPRTIILYPQLSSGATDAQRTLNYYVYRRPHEVFYDVDREMDMHIGMKSALRAGVIAKAYAFRDRDGYVSKYNLYQEEKRKALKKYKRQRGRPIAVRDVQGDCMGYEV